jgi:hypothetical protein
MIYTPIPSQQCDTHAYPSFFEDCYALLQIKCITFCLSLGQVFSLYACQSTASCIINIAKLWISLSFLTRATLLSRKANKFGMLLNVWTMEKEKQKVSTILPQTKHTHIDRSVTRQRNQQRN